VGFFEGNRAAVFPRRAGCAPKFGASTKAAQRKLGFFNGDYRDRFFYYLKTDTISGNQVIRISGHQANLNEIQ